MTANAARLPPHNLDAEAAVLSAVLLYREALDTAAERLMPEHFYSTANGEIFGAALAVAALAVKVLPWFTQRNGAWIALLLPVHSALWLASRRAAHRRPTCAGRRCRRW